MSCIYCRTYRVSRAVRNISCEVCIAEIRTWQQPTLRTHLRRWRPADCCQLGFKELQRRHWVTSDQLETPYEVSVLSARWLLGEEMSIKVSNLACMCIKSDILSLCLLNTAVKCLYLMCISYPSLPTNSDMLLKLKAIPAFIIPFCVVLVVHRRCVIKDTAELLKYSAMLFHIFVCFKLSFCQASLAF
jgi:hypothetical protein